MKDFVTAHTPSLVVRADPEVKRLLNEILAELRTSRQQSAQFHDEDRTSEDRDRLTPARATS